MTVPEAKQIQREFYNKTNPTEEEYFLYTEALQFLIRETRESEYMVELGGMYYEQKQYDLALKYYEMAAEYENLYAISNLGYIWYYGRTGERNYEKAFYYFDKARQMGDMIAAYKVADMYKNGYYVEKDPDKYREIIGKLYRKLKDSRWPGDPVPEVFTRLAAIRAEEGKTEKALCLYDTAREVLSRRIQDHSFFGDRNIMKWMINDIYRLREIKSSLNSLRHLWTKAHVRMAHPKLFPYDSRSLQHYTCHARAATKPCSVLSFHNIRL